MIPLYKRCGRCKEVWNVSVLNTDDPYICPYCATELLNGQLRERILSLSNSKGQPKKGGKGHEI